MNKSETQSDILLNIVKEEEPIIDDSTIDNELNYQLIKDNDSLPNDKDSKKEETIGKISAEDLF